MDTIPPSPLPPQSRQPNGPRILRWSLATLAVAALGTATTVLAAMGLSAQSGPSPASAGSIQGRSELPALGELNLTTLPVGARAHLDDRDLGTTPLTETSVAPGFHHLTLVAKNYRAWSGDVSVAPGQPLIQNIALSPLPAVLHIETALPGAHISTEGAPTRNLPGTMEILPGDRAVRIEASGFRPWEGSFSLQPNEQLSLYLVTSGSDLSLTYGDPADGVAMMIDNLADARPQAGLDRADVVYEALAEGGITRYMALFLTQAADTVGPIRSTRHYFVNWANEYQAPLMHIGASPQGYNAIASTHLPTVDGLGFWRTSRAAPHNAYTSTASVQSRIHQRQPATFGGLRYSTEDRASLGLPADGVQFNYGSQAYSVLWRYDPALGTYARSLNGQLQQDAGSGSPITASNVLITWMDSWLIPDDDAGRLDFRQVGSGRLLALTQGRAVEGQWNRTSLRSITEYHDSEGNQLLLRPGSTWIQVVPLRTPVDLLGPRNEPTGGPA